MLGSRMATSPVPLSISGGLFHRGLKPQYLPVSHKLGLLVWIWMFSAPAMGEIEAKR